MTAEDHNKYLGIAHLLYAGLYSFIMIAMSLFFLLMMGLIGASASRSNEVPPLFFLIILGFVFLINALFTVPSFLAAYAFLKRKSWAKVMGIVAGILAAMSFPFGTAVCIYTFWFLFGEKGRALYGERSYALPPPPPIFGTAVFEQGREREREYVPPNTPPDWR
jgi:hypothetical protein